MTHRLQDVLFGEADHGDDECTLFLLCDQPAVGVLTNAAGPGADARGCQRCADRLTALGAPGPFTLDADR